jgi:hypothetical protein
MEHAVNEKRGNVSAHGARQRSQGRVSGFSGLVRLIPKFHEEPVEKQFGPYVASLLGMTRKGFLRALRALRALRGSKNLRVLRGDIKNGFPEFPEEPKSVTLVFWDTLRVPRSARSGWQRRAR